MAKTYRETVVQCAGRIEGVTHMLLKAHVKEVKDAYARGYSEGWDARENDDDYEDIEPEHTEPSMERGEP